MKYCIRCNSYIINNPRNNKKYCADCKITVNRENIRRSRSKPKEANCKLCGKEFVTKYKAKYCSNECRRKAKGEWRKVKEKPAKKPQMSIKQVLRQIDKIYKETGKYYSYGQYVALKERGLI